MIERKSKALRFIVLFIIFCIIDRTWLYSQPQKVYINDYIFSVNMGSFSLGDIPKFLGKSLVIGESDGRPYISSLTDDGELLLEGLNFSGDFEIMLAVDWNSFDKTIRFTSDGDNDVKLSFTSKGLKVGAILKEWRRTSWKMRKEINVIEFVSKNDIVRVFVNYKYIGSVEIKSGLKFTKFIIRGIKQDDSIFNLKGFCYHKQETQETRKE